MTEPVIVKTKIINARPAGAMNNITVHLANEHGIQPASVPPEQRHVIHAFAHVYGDFREGQGHFHPEDAKVAV